MAEKFVPYKDQLNDPRWHYVKNRVLERDKWQCKKCRSEHNLQVHHLKYLKGFMAWDYNDSYLTTLCDSCHQKAHGITKSETGADMRDPFVRLSQFVKDWKRIVIHMDENDIPNYEVELKGEEENG